MNDLPNAADMRRKVEACENEKSAKELKLIGEALERATTNSISISFYPSANVKAILESKGYTVTSTSFRNETEVTIHF